MTTRIFPAWDDLDRLKIPLTHGERVFLAYLDENLPMEWRIYSRPFFNGLRPEVVVFNPFVGLTIYSVVDMGQGSPDVVATAAPVGLKHISEIDRVYYYRRKLIGELIPNIGEACDRDPNAFAMIKVGIYYHGTSAVPAVDGLPTRIINTLRFTTGDLSTNPRMNALGRILPGVTFEKCDLWSKDWNEHVLFWMQPPFHTLEHAVVREWTNRQQSVIKPRPGHFKVRGAAGSGKTNVLAERAAALAAIGQRVLVVTFNITLWHYIRDLVNQSSYAFDPSLIEYNHFHGLCHDTFALCGYDWPNGSGEIFWTKDLPGLLNRAIETWTAQGNNELSKFDAILIDEGQDFCLEWYRILSSQFLGERNELVLVCDQRQNVYSRDASWVEKPMPGVTLQRRWRELETVFRMPHIIANIAEDFSKTFCLNQDIRIRSVVQLGFGERTGTPHFEWHNARMDTQDTCEWLWVARRRLQERGIDDRDIVALLPTHADGLQCVDWLKDNDVDVCHIFAQENADRRRNKRSFWPADTRLKLSTIQSFKGWEARGVILLLVGDWLPEHEQAMEASSSSGEAIQWFDSAVYCSITRAMEALLILNTSERYWAFGEKCSQSILPGDPRFEGHDAIAAHL